MITGKDVENLKEELNLDDPIQKSFFLTQDDLNPFPAATTLLYKVCDGNSKKFHEAVRLIELFMKTAINLSSQKKDN